MADELDPVVQEFRAEMDQYMAELEEGSERAKSFADANVEASAAIDDMRDHAGEAEAEIVQLSIATGDAAEADGKLRDSAAEAAAELGHLRDNALEAAAAEKRLDDQTASVKGKVDDLKKAVDDADSGGGSAGGGVGGLLGKLFSGGSSGGGLAGMLPDGAILPALAAIVPAVEAALVEVTGLVSGFAAAGAGAGAFALLAMPAFKAVTGAYTQINTDQKAYDDALTKTAKNTALKKLQQDYKDLDPAERGAVKGIQGLMDTYHQMAKAFEPDAFKVFNDGLRIANQLLPAVKPFADTFATTLDKLLQQASKFAGSTGFKDWLAQFQKLEGPSLTAIGDGIGKVAVAIGHLLTVMSAKDVVNSLNIAFSIIAGTINVLTGMVARLMSNWDQMSAAFRTASHAVSADADAMRADLVNAGHTIEAAVNSMVHGVSSDLDSMREDIISAGHAIEAAWDAVISFFRGIPGKASSALSALPGDLERIGVNAIEGFLRGIESAAGGLLSEVSNLAGDVSSAFSKVLGILSPSRVFREHGVNTLQGYIDGIKATAPAVHAALAAVGGSVAAGGITGVGGAVANGSSVHVNVPITLGAGTQGYNSPQFLQYIQQTVQEATLRYTQINPSNGLTLAGKIA